MLTADGLSDGEIAAKLNLSLKTINFRMEEIKCKLNSKTRVQVVAMALRQGWIYYVALRCPAWDWR